MSFVLRSWHCLNAKCGNAFEAYDAAPKCPVCRCVKVAWVPGGGHIGKVAGGIDRTLNGLAAQFGLTDMGQRGGTRAGEPAVRDRAPNGVIGTFKRGEFELPVGSTPTAGFASRPSDFKITSKGARNAAPRNAKIPTTIATGPDGSRAIDNRPVVL